MIRFCKICGKEFEATRNRKTCSEDCFKKNKAIAQKTAVANQKGKKEREKEILSGWLTIPDAPNYEINAKLQLRNKKTGKILSVCSERRGIYIKRYYSLRSPGQKHTLKRSPETFRAQAVEAANPGKNFLPIPSLGGRYEISQGGVVRHTKTKKIIARRSNREHSVNLYAGGYKWVCRTIADLLWEVHGKIIKRCYNKVACYAENENGKHFFLTLMACARFLAPKLYYSCSTIHNYLIKRRPTIGKWKISYVILNPPEVKWDKKALDALARQQQKNNDLLYAK